MRASVSVQASGSRGRDSSAGELRSLHSRGTPCAHVAGIVVSRVGAGITCVGDRAHGVGIRPRM